MNDEDFEEIRVIFPAAQVSRIGNCIMVKCETEDDAIVVFEIFRNVAIRRKLDPS